jgi:protein-disulfide isomerase
LAVVAVLVAMFALVVGAAGSGAAGVPVKGSKAVESLIGKLPQRGLTLGDPSATVELIEFGDLQCPICKEYAERVLPRVIRNEIAKGKAKITFRNFLIIGPESLQAGAAAVAAGEQGRGGSFIETFLRNQGQEDSVYVTGAFLESIAEAAGVEDLARWNAARASAKAIEQVRATTREANHKLHLTGTPSFAIRGPATHGQEELGTPENAADIEAAVAAAR